MTQCKSSKIKSGQYIFVYRLKTILFQPAALIKENPVDVFSNKLSKFSSEHSFTERLLRALIGAKIRDASQLKNCTCLKPCCRVKEGSAGGTYNFEHLVRFGNVDFFIVNVKGKPSYFRDTDM